MVSISWKLGHSGRQISLVIHGSRLSADRHSMALAGGALLTYAWHAFPETPVFDTPRTADLIGNAVFALFAIGVLVSATIRCEKSSHA